MEKIILFLSLLCVERYVYFIICYFEFVSHQSFLLHSYPLNDAAETVNEIGATIGSVMGGTSGILYSSYPCFLIDTFT